MVRGRVGRKRDARYGDHDDEVPRAPRLEVAHRAEDRERGDGDELGPEREGLEVPRKLGQAMAPSDDVHLVERRPVRERERADQGLIPASEPRRVVRGEGAGEGRRVREGVGEEGEAMSLGGVEQEVKVGADLQPEAEEERVDERVDHFYGAAEHVLRGQLERAAHWKRTSQARGRKGWGEIGHLRMRYPGRIQMIPADEMAV